MPDDRGAFLDRTYRLHPALTSFVSDRAYEGRLKSATGRERIAVDAWTSALAVRWVQHAKPSAAACTDGARAVAERWGSLQGAGWVDAEGVERPIRPDDVLVVAPSTR